MTALKTRASEVLARGVEERGNFEPKGTPLKMYQWWAEDSLNAPEHENFCHFWRVVFFWAPFWFTVEKTFNFVTSKKVFAPIAALLAFGVYQLFVTPGALLVFGQVTGIILACIAIVAMGVGIGLLVERYSPPILKENAGLIFLGLFGLITLGGVTGLLVMAVMDFGWIALAYVAAGVAVVVSAIFGLSKFADYLSGRRALARDQQEKAIQDFLENFDPDAEPVAVEEREPGPVARFFSGVGDFLILVFQVVRTKKWKICPMVTVPRD